MNDPLLLGLDVGSTNIKAAVFDRTGRTVALASRPMRTHYPRPGWAYYEPGELWGDTAGAIREALAGLAPSQVNAIAGVAAASIGETGVPLNADGDPTYHAIAWFETRTQPQTDRLAETIGPDELFAVSGLSLQPIWSLCKLLWLRDAEPDAFDRTVRWLNTADYVAYRLCGVGATDHSLASRTHAYNIRERRWDAGLLGAVGISPGLWAPLVASGTALGHVTREAANETGLPETAVVVAGGHDHVVGALAAGIVDPGQILNSLGTAEALFLPTERPIMNPELGNQGYTQGAHVVPGRYYAFGGQYTVGAAIDWAKDMLGADHPTLIAEAEVVPPGSLGVTFLPYLRLAAPPISDPRARGAWVGLSTDAGRGALFRAVLEGLAFESMASLRGLIAHIEIPMPEEVVAIGGVTNNRLLMRIKATTLDRSFVVAGVTEATALGAALLGGIGAGVYRDAAEAIAALDYLRTRFDPVSEDVARYNAIFEDVYRLLYPALRPVNHAIYRLERVGD